MSIGGKLHDIPLRCACGILNGMALSVAPNMGARIICYCGDCRAYARFLGRPGIVNDWGGTDVFQIAPSRLQLTGGAEALGCVRLSEKGLHRWHCRECKTPIANTLGARVPFAGLVHTFIDVRGYHGSRDTFLGPPIAHVRSRFTPAAPSTRGLSLLKAVGYSGSLLGKWWLSGVGSPSPFFDGATRAPRVQPRVLTPDERAGLRESPGLGDR